jgi:hypothetical protein
MKILHCLPLLTQRTGKMKEHKLSGMNVIRTDQLFSKKVILTYATSLLYTTTTGCYFPLAHLLY